MLITDKTSLLWNYFIMSFLLSSLCSAAKSMTSIVFISGSNSEDLMISHFRFSLHIYQYRIGQVSREGKLWLNIFWPLIISLIIETIWIQDTWWWPYQLPVNRIKFQGLYNEKKKFHVEIMIIFDSFAIWAIALCTGGNVTVLTLNLFLSNIMTVYGGRSQLHFLDLGNCHDMEGGDGHGNSVSSMGMSLLSTIGGQKHLLRK